MADHARLTELFTQAIDLDAPAQAQLIADVRAGDPALADELAAMLAADDNIVTALRTAGLKPDDTTGALRDPTIPFQNIGIDNYRVTGTLGKGGMGVVYAAARLRPPLPVAIKVLHVTAPEAIARFEAEFAIMKRLEHPAIARVLEAGESGGRPYIVMEHVDGVTLDAFVKARAPSLRERLELVAAVCDGVQYAHENGVVHRDLKPTNIMVRRAGGIAILDFGVARTAGSTRTQHGDVVGTLTYMAPEQAAGRAADVDERTDIYALGVVLFELVAGRAPHDLAGVPLVAAIQTITTRLAPPLACGSDALDAVCAAALAKAKADRPSSAAELARQIRDVVAHHLPRS